MGSRQTLEAGPKVEICECSKPLPSSLLSSPLHKFRPQPTNSDHKRELELSYGPIRVAVSDCFSEQGGLTAENLEKAGNSLTHQHPATTFEETPNNIKWRPEGP